MMEEREKLDGGSRLNERELDERSRPTWRKEDGGSGRWMYVCTRI